jgi:hypothetical protein
VLWCGEGGGRGVALKFRKDAGGREDKILFRLRDRSEFVSAAHKTGGKWVSAVGFSYRPLHEYREGFMAGSTIIKGLGRTDLFNQRNLTVTAGSAGLVTVNAAAYSRFTGFVSGVGSMTVRIRFGTDSKLFCFFYLRYQFRAASFRSTKSRQVRGMGNRSPLTRNRSRQFY